mmetsp:Transcript_92518/g.160735  ORF Transcript_92518/g.160735 Transcript_92518/m.160735 type:complete len:204 (+) Transcript_92518:1542-2153(+)
MLLLPWAQLLRLRVEVRIICCVASMRTHTALCPLLNKIGKVLRCTHELKFLANGRMLLELLCSLLLTPRAERKVVIMHHSKAPSHFQTGAKVEDETSSLCADSDVPNRSRKLCTQLLSRAPRGSRLHRPTVQRHLDLFGALLGWCLPINNEDVYFPHITFLLLAQVLQHRLSGMLPPRARPTVLLVQGLIKILERGNNNNLHH